MRRGAREGDEIVHRMELALSRSQVCNAHESRIRKVARNQMPASIRLVSLDTALKDGA